MPRDGGHATPEPSEAPAEAPVEHRGQHGTGRHGSKGVKFPKSPFWYNPERGDFQSDPSGGTHVGQGYRRLPDGYVPGTEGYQENGAPTPGIQAFLDKGYKLWTPDMGFDL